MTKKKQGAPKGNKNAAKEEGKTMFAPGRLTPEMKNEIKIKAARRGLSQIKYIEWLVSNDKP